MGEDETEYSHSKPQQCYQWAEKYDTSWNPTVNTSDKLHVAVQNKKYVIPKGQDKLSTNYIQLPT
jgi:hypothetical protein